MILVLFCGAAWGTACPTGYTNSYTINIPANAVFGGSTLTNKGWLWEGGSIFAQSGSGGQSLTAGGLDIVFCDSTATNLIAYELVANTYNSSTGYGQWYFLVSSLSPSTGANVTVEVGKASASNLSSAAGVWGSSGENNLMVHHFGTSGTLTLTDSTGNCTATNNGATAAAGFLDGGAAFSGSSQWIDTGCTASASTFTVEAWNKAASATSFGMIANNLNTGQTNGFFFARNLYGLELELGTGSGAAIYQVTASRGIPSVALSQWQQVAFSFNGGSPSTASSYAVYTNGLPVGGSVTQTAGTSYATPTVDLLYGRWVNSSFPDYYNGTMDEMRVCGCVRSAGWIQTSWFNLAFPVQSSYLGSTNTIPSTGLDQLPQIIQFSNSSGVFPKNLTAGSSILVIGRATSVPSAPTGCGATYTLIDSNTAGTAGANPYVYIGTGGSGSCAVTFTGAFGYHAIELPSALGSTIDVHNNGSLAVGGQVFPTALTTTQNNEFMFCFVIGNGAAESILATAVSNSLPQWNALTALSGTSSTLAESYAYTGVNGSYQCPFDNYNGESASASSAEQYVTLAFKASSLTIATASLPTATVNSPYFYTLQSMGGVGALTWSLSSGSLPAGLTLNANGTITGTPTAGTTTATFQVTDGTHTATQSLTLTVNSSASSVSVVTSTSNASATATTISLGSVTSGNLIIACTMANNDTYIQLMTDTLGTPYKFLGTVNSRYSGLSLLQQFACFQGVAPSSGSDSVTCNSISVCYPLAIQLSNAQPFFDNFSGIIGSAINIGSNATFYGPPLLTPGSEFIWGAVASWPNSGTDLNLAVGSGWTGDASSGNTGVADMLGEHQTGSGGFTPSWSQTTSSPNPYQMMIDLALRSTTSGVVGSGGFPVVY